MATPPSANAAYQDPAPAHSRRNSSRMSFASSMSRSTSHLGSPRTACPKDGDAFSYNPSHLRVWYLPQNIWDRLPTQLQCSIAAVQHSGAAVLTGFDRLGEHKDTNDDVVVQLDDLGPPKFRTASNASSTNPSDISSPLTGRSPGSQSESASPITSSGHVVSHLMSPVSVLSIGQAKFSSTRDGCRDRSFSVPLEPHDAYYATELSHLRTEALPRLRHMCHKVDTEWYGAKRAGNISTEDVNNFENWWAEKKCHVLNLDEKGKRLAHIRGLSKTGMGWCAP